jgi:hypothetical protein
MKRKRQGAPHGNEVIALTERMPDACSILAGLPAGGPDLHPIRRQGAAVQLRNAEGRHKEQHRSLDRHQGTPLIVTKLDDRPFGNRLSLEVGAAGKKAGQDTPSVRHAVGQCYDVFSHTTPSRFP